MDKKLSKFQIGNIYVGLMIILSGVIPTGLLIRKIFGGMYGPTFKNLSPAVYHLINISISYLVTGFFVYVILKKLDIFNRLNKNYASTTLFAIGNGVILFYLRWGSNGCFYAWHLPVIYFKGIAVYCYCESSYWSRATDENNK